MSKTRRKTRRERTRSNPPPAPRRGDRIEGATGAAAAVMPLPVAQLRWHGVRSSALSSERSVAFGVLGASLFLGAAIRVWLSFNDDGIYWPDEIYQSLEPAHRLVFGYGIVPWEFIDGARNWAFPAFVAGLFQVGRLFGDDPRGYLGLTRLAFSAIGIATAVGSYRLARVHGARALPAPCGAAVIAL